MKITAWRVIKEKHAATAFSGKGASVSGGRWNSRGVWVVYTSSTKSLAALETLVHINPFVRFHYVIFPITFDHFLVEQVAQISPLPSDWRDQPPPTSTKQLGDRWISQARSSVLEVPSVIIPSESNYLLNPYHPDFQKISMRKPEPFAFDSRLLG